MKNNKHLIPFLIELEEFRQSPLSLEKAKFFFDQQQYAKTLKEIKDAIGISSSVRVKLQKNHRLNSPGAILLPANPFIIPDVFFEREVFLIAINPIYFNDFDKFVTVLSHELSHLLLFINKNKLWNNEKAVDVCSIVTGFGQFIAVSRKHNMGYCMVKLGYLNDTEFEFILDCALYDRRFIQKPTKKLTLYQKILNFLKIFGL